MITSLIKLSGTVIYFTLELFHVSCNIKVHVRIAQLVFVPVVQTDIAVIEVPMVLGILDSKKTLYLS